MSNAYATYPLQRDSPKKFEVNPHEDIRRHLCIFKTEVAKDGHAYY